MQLRIALKLKHHALKPVTPGLPGVHVTGSVPSAASSIGPTSVDTELSAELSSFPEGVTGIKLVSLQAAVTDVTSVISPAASGIVRHSSSHETTPLFLSTHQYPCYF
jgi:hypothetical protein